MGNLVVVVVGSTMIDMITYAQRLPDRGETVQGETFAMGFGGKGANQASMASRLGASVYMVNTLGDDLFGDSTLKNFAEQGINTTYIKRVHGASGVAPIWVEPDGTNRIICVPGANYAMTAQDAVRAIDSIENIGIVVGQLEVPQAVTAAAFAAAREKGIITILNPAPSAELSPELLEASDWIIPNEHEFASLHPRHLLPDNDDVISELAGFLKKRILVTLGQAGAAYCDESGTVRRVAAPKVEAKDTTGAGDAFVGAFAFGLASGFGEERAATLGCICASDSVTRLGTQSSYPSREQAVELIKESLG